MPEAQQNRVPGRGRMLSAVSVVAIGVIFWLRQSRPELGSKVWTLFLCVPASLFLSIAWGHYRRAGGVTRSMATWVTGALVLVLLMAVVLTGTPWASTWPGFVVIAGIAGAIRAAARS
jgi:hypothetical protein